MHLAYAFPTGMEIILLVTHSGTGQCSEEAEEEEDEEEEEEDFKNLFLLPDS